MRLVLLTCLLTSLSSFAEQEGLRIYLNKKAFQITGQLAPFRFLVDGKLLFERPRSYVSLKLNGVRVPFQEENQRVFSFETDSDQLVLEVADWNDVKERLKLEPGRLSSSQWNGEKFLFGIAGNVARAEINGKNVPILNSKIEWTPKDKKLTPNKLLLVGEGDIPSVLLEFQLVTSREFVQRVLAKRAENKANRARLIAPGL